MLPPTSRISPAMRRQHTFDEGVRLSLACAPSQEEAHDPENRNPDDRLPAGSADHELVQPLPHQLRMLPL